MRILWPFLATLAVSSPAQTHQPNPLYTAPEGEPLAGLRICVDPGHGGQIWGATRGYTGGTRSRVTSQTESEANLRVGLFLWDLLTQAGAEVVMTRTFETRLSEDCFADPDSDEFRANRREELNIRVRVAETNDCDLLLAIHHNAVGNSEVNFSTAFYFDPERYTSDQGTDPPVEHAAAPVERSRTLAEAIVQSLDETLQLGTRPARHGNYHVLRETSLPSVLVECAFMTNREQSVWMEDLSYSRLAAIAIFEAILQEMGAEPDADEASEEVSS
jgi:N-acetylmuramoyl-L-alanine amidase